MQSFFATKKSTFFLKVFLGVIILLILYRMCLINFMDFFTIATLTRIKESLFYKDINFEKVSGNTSIKLVSDLSKNKSIESLDNTSNKSVSNLSEFNLSKPVGNTANKSDDFKFNLTVNTQAKSIKSPANSSSTNQSSTNQSSTNQSSENQSSANQSKTQVCNERKTYKQMFLKETYDEKVLRRHPNLPTFLIESPELLKLIPQLPEIRWSGELLQESWKESPKCHLYSANFDSRLNSGLVVRVTASCEGRKMPPKFYCQLWYNATSNPSISKVYEADFPRGYPGDWVSIKTLILSCKVPTLIQGEEKFPVAVSIVIKPCTKPTNILKIGASPFKKDNNFSEKDNITIGICGKAIYYYNLDFSARLIEWIELMRIMGISKFFIYKTACHKNVSKVLDYYESKGIVKVVLFHYASPYVQENTFVRLWSKALENDFMDAQRVFYNDCILRNKDDFDYLAIFDYDEIPMLGKHQNLIEAVQHLRRTVKESKNISAFKLNWIAFYRDLSPSEAAQNVSNSSYILRHNRRASFEILKRRGNAFKSIYDTNKAFYVRVHVPAMHRHEPPLTDYAILPDRNIIYLGHFTEKLCSKECKGIATEEDNALLKHEKKLLTQMDEIYKEIKFQE